MNRLQGFSLDLKLGGRMLVKYPGLTIVAGLAMAFAICVGTVLFAVLGLSLEQVAMLLAYATLMLGGCLLACVVPPAPRPPRGADDRAPGGLAFPAGFLTNNTFVGPALLRDEPTESRRNSVGPDMRSLTATARTKKG